MSDTIAQLKALNGFCAKSDGKDKLTALIQYTCMFISAGEPGNARKIQASVTAARKIFRIMRPFEALMPIITNPHLNKSKPVPIEIIGKLKNVLMAAYFGADHVVWAGQAGVLTDKDVLARFQKISLYSWAGGSVCTAANEAYELMQISKIKRKGETDSEWAVRRAKTVDEVNTRLLTLFHSIVQTALAGGLLQLFGWKPRTIGLVGIIASAINCYTLFPPIATVSKAPAKALPGNSHKQPEITPEPKLELKKA